MGAATCLLLRRAFLNAPQMARNREFRLMSNLKEILSRRPLPSSLRRLREAEPRKALVDRQADRWNQLALDMVADSVLFFSAPTTRLANVNRAACHHLGYSRQQLRRMSLVEIAPHATRGSLANRIASAMQGNVQDAYLQTVYRHQDGTLLPVQCSIRALQKRPNSLLVAVARDIKGHDKFSGPYFDAVFRDPLTGLSNRAWLLQQLENDAQRAQQSDYRFAVLFIDVDRFKAVNDSFGHLVGDHVLQAVARRLTASVRPGDAVARYGGDEFVVLMRDVRCPKSIDRIARRIGRRVIAAGTLFGGKQWRVRVTVSIGVAISGGERSASITIDRADRAMYRAKAQGRNGRFVIDELSQSRCG